MNAMPEPRPLSAVPDSKAIPEGRKLLGSAETRRFLTDFVRRRVPESHIDDVVQTVLVSALEAPQLPQTESELRRWLTGVAKHKIADLHRKSGREQPTELPDIETSPPPIEERLMTEWAESQAKHSKDAETLRWMAREGEGEKLEQIAAEEKVEAATVRQRVSRMRRWMKERWIAELAAVAVIALLGVFVYRWLKTKPVEAVRDVPTAEPIGPMERATELRRAALDQCEKHLYQECLKGLDQAKELDPEGDSAPEVQGARAQAKKAIESAPSSAPDPKTSRNKKGNDPNDDANGLVPEPGPSAAVDQDSKNQPGPPTSGAPFSTAPKAPPMTKGMSNDQKKKQELEQKFQQNQKPSTSFDGTGTPGSKPMPNEPPAQFAVPETSATAQSFTK
jgi:RNA polymerase sigma factor (sigma-70 family)